MRMNLTVFLVVILTKEIRRRFFYHVAHDIGFNAELDAARWNELDLSDLMVYPVSV